MSGIKTFQLNEFLNIQDAMEAVVNQRSLTIVPYSSYFGGLKLSDVVDDLIPGNFGDPYYECLILDRDASQLLAYVSRHDVKHEQTPSDEGDKQITHFHKFVDISLLPSTDISSVLDIELLHEPLGSIHLQAPAGQSIDRFSLRQTGSQNISEPEPNKRWAYEGELRVSEPYQPLFKDLLAYFRLA